jgi:hypothetical protein
MKKIVKAALILLGVGVVAILYHYGFIAQY